MDFFLIIVASGKGARLKSAVPKQFIQISGKSILEHSLKSLTENFNFSKIVITLPKTHTFDTSKISDQKVSFIRGGIERSDSVFNALKFLEPFSKKGDFVFIHDAVRPFVNKDFAKRLLKKIGPKIHGLIPVIPVTDTVKEIKNNKITRTVDRTHLGRAQTPQVFNFKTIFDCYEKQTKKKKAFTDDAMLLELNGFKVETVEGDFENIKITYDSDLNIMKEKFMNTRIGYGYDAHRLVPNRDLILCGEKFDYEKGLLGHSDADVAVHALMDALLGAAAMGDIGMLFPDSDKKFKDISSMKLLETVNAKIIDAGFEIANVDLTIIAEEPKIMPKREKMIMNISKVLKIPVSRINLKATTTEGMGFHGRKEGISAIAVCLLKG